LSLVLFDIDGTLLLSGGAGVRAMTQAFEAVFGVRDAFAGLAIAGRTDTFLVSRALIRANLADTPEEHERFRQVYIPTLVEEITRPGSGRRGVMPGVEDLLAALQRQPPFHVALLTGNFEPAARIKLSYFGLAEFFVWGAFGEESADRNELGRLAIERAATQAVPPEARARAVIVGDTPHDIECARAVGARAIAVATGSYAAAELEHAGADVVLPDLSDTTRVLELLR
jgi:phosphoglycolate phosphatase